MNIIDQLRDYKSKKSYEEINAEALKMFDSQKGAIKEISNTIGYKELKKYFERLKEASVTRMISGKNDERAKATYEVAHDFLKFLESREV